MVVSVTVLVAFVLQLAMADVYYPPTPTPPTTTPSPVTTTTMATTTLAPVVPTTVAPVVLMNAFMDNMRYIMSMYPPPPYMAAGPAGYPVAPSNYPPMGNQYYEAAATVAPAVPIYNNYVPQAAAAAAPVYGGMPSAPVNNYAAASASGYVTTVRPAPYGVVPNNYGSSYASFGPSNIYGIGSRPSAPYYGNGYQQQLPYNYNNNAAVGYYNNQPSYPMNIAYHGHAW